MTWTSGTCTTRGLLMRDHWDIIVTLIFTALFLIFAMIGIWGGVKQGESTAIVMALLAAVFGVACVIRREMRR
jgi:hypothetical protein